MNKILTYHIDADGVAVVTLDMHDYPTNVLNPAMADVLISTVKQLIDNQQVKGVVLTSAKRDFIAGADLHFLESLRSTQEAFSQTMSLHQALLDIERGGKPLVAAINGSALGGGYEIALACHYRIAARNAQTQIGLPEVKLGLLPGGGGTQRLPRLIGIQEALQLILQAETLNPEEALSKGLIHKVVAPQDLLTEAKQWILNGGSPIQPWNKQGYKIPGGAVMSPAGAQIFAAGTAMLRQKTAGNYPSAQYALSAVYEGLQLPIERGVQIEARYFVNAVFSKEARNIIRSGFFGINKANKGVARPADTPTAPLQRIGIVGAGMMGAGIAYVAALSGLEVVLKDVSLQAAEKGKDYSRQLAEKKIQKGGDPNKYNNLLQRIVTTDDTALFAQCDLVIEAVFENRALKAQVTNEVEAVIPPQAVFASNTSTLPITGLAQASSRPHQFIGIHFFSPVDKMPLVEIIVGKQTNSSTLATAIDLALRLRKTPIVVNDSRGFFTSRVFATYTNEGMELLREGTPPARIENVAKASGMPVGPLAVTDEVNLALAHKILRQTEQDLGIPNQTATAFVTELFVNQLNRPGKKEGKGFYEYPANAKKYLWEGLQTHFPPVATSPDDATVRKRLLHIQALETYRCLTEGVLRSFTDGDIGSILGFGFPPYTGGALSYIDYIGIHTFIAECDHFTQQYGSRFEVPQSLRQLANQQGWAFVPPLVVLNA